MNDAVAPGIGHNRPDLETLAGDDIDDRLVHHRDRRDELLASYGRCPAIDTQTNAEAAVTLSKQMQDLLRRVSIAHEDAKRPWLEAGRLIDGKRSKFVDDVVDAKNDIDRKVTAFHKAVAAAAEADRAERAAKFEEKGDPEPSYAPAPKKRHAIRSDSGASAHLHTRKIHSVVDPKKIPMTILRSDKVTEAIISVARGRLDAGEKVPGITTRTEEVSQIR